MPISKGSIYDSMSATEEVLFEDKANRLLADSTWTIIEKVRPLTEADYGRIVEFEIFHGPGTLSGITKPDGFTLKSSISMTFFAEDLILKPLRSNKMLNPSNTKVDDLRAYACISDAKPRGTTSNASISTSTYAVWYLARFAGDPTGQSLMWACRWATTYTNPRFRIVIK